MAHLFRKDDRVDLVHKASGKVVWRGLIFKASFEDEGQEWYVLVTPDGYVVRGSGLWAIQLHSAE